MPCRPEVRRPEQNNLYVKTGRGGSMQRREALKLLLAGGVLPGLRTDLFGFFRDAHPASGYALRALSPNQNDMVVAMIDHIIPATDTPGARAARRPCRSDWDSGCATRIRKRDGHRGRSQKDQCVVPATRRRPKATSALHAVA